jgi:glycine C-acetyltransferase
MTQAFRDHLARVLAEIETAGLTKHERVLTTAQQPQVATAVAGSVLNFCANNYLGLANHPALIQAAHAALDRWGYGLSSVRFICGTQQIHRELEQRLSEFLHTEDTILYSSCFDANAGVFETLLGSDDAVISDELNHASIIDGVRLSKARRFRYRNCDMADLDAKLREADAGGARFKLIVTDGVFSMDGVIAPLREICEVADRHQALVMVDDSHAVGFTGATGRGTPELCGVMERIDLLTGTLGKALGGASGGYASGRKEIIALLRQRSRPYLFSNSVAPVITATSLAVLDLLEHSDHLRAQLAENTRFFRAGLTAAGLTIRPGTHPIVPVMLGDAALAQKFAERMLARGIFVVGFFFPVVPLGAARIRVQVSAAHTRDDLERAIAAFSAVASELDCSRPQ